MSYTFDIYTRERIFARAGWHCECGCDNCLGPDNLEVHHRVSNSKVNRKIYGERIQSEENAAVLCGWCHVHCKHLFKDFRKGE